MSLVLTAVATITNAAFVAIILLITPLPARAQEPAVQDSVEIILDQIGKLESNRDPKCYATAARLEDFMFGTPLAEDARFLKSDLQKELISRLWAAASDAAAARGASTIDESIFPPLTAAVTTVEQTAGGDVRVGRNGEWTRIARRDLDHYGSIAYSYRAILSVQQEHLLSGRRLLPLSRGAIEHLRTWLDSVTLAALHAADQEARQKSERVVSAELIAVAWKKLVSPDPGPTVVSRDAVSARKPGDFSLTRAIAAEKIASYEAYNDISLPLFMRNLQVYFARFYWPKDPAVSEQIKISFNESMIAFVADTLAAAAARAQAEGKSVIDARHVMAALQAFVPFQVNEYEDVVFFPGLPASEQVTLEAYDTDSFRDSGLHWRYLQEAIDQSSGTINLEPDPFAAELIVEGVAQFGVLALRMAGRVAREDGAAALDPGHLRRAFGIIQQKVDRHAARGRRENLKTTLASSSSVTPESTSFFADVTAASGIAFEHRSSDWLSRMLRSYIRKSETGGTLTIPHAFAGGGVAAEDVNRDGHADVLLVSGKGNSLFINRGDGTFRDVSAKVSLNVRRPDGTWGEPRQPLIADFDNDGLQDILIIYANDDHRLYRNRGDLAFDDVTRHAGLGGKGLIAGPATAADIDGDGLLDLYIGYFGNYVNGVFPNLSRRNLNASSNRLFLNQGNLRFKDITADSGAGHTGWAQAMSHTDLDGDRRQDLIVGNDFGVNAYLRNLGAGKFEDVTEKIGTGKPSFAMSVGIADLNGDSAPDFYISNIVTMVKDEKYVLPSEETVMKFNPDKLARMRVIEANDLFISAAGTNGLPHYTLSDSVDRGFAATGWAWDADFFDFDLDGDDDLYVLNGMNEYMVYSSTPYQTAVKDGTAEITLPVAEREANVFFINEDGRLRFASEKSGIDYLGNSRSAAYADIDSDGDLDIIVNNYHGPALVYRNLAERFGNNWMKVKLAGNPDRGSNRDAIGARLIVEAPGGLRVWREIRGSEGYLSVHPREQHFGVGTETRVDLTIIWPNGEVQRLEDLEANHRHEIVQK